MQTTGNTEEQEGQIRHCQEGQEASEKASTVLEQILWIDETRINLHQNNGKINVWRWK